MTRSGTITVPCLMRRAVHPNRTVVVKIGSSSLASGGEGIDRDAIERIANQLDQLWRGGNPCVLVTSGAVAAGLPALGLTERPDDVPSLQVAAAIGQGRLMQSYGSAFGDLDRLVAQILITRDVFAQRSQYLHARWALDRMRELEILPIVNENDTVVVDELRFGDNDRLAAIVSHIVQAGMLVILSDTPGLFSDDPWYSDEPELLDAVNHTDQVLDAIAGGRSGGLGSGGVASKVAAARMAAWSGIPTVIAPASEPDAVERAISGKDVGTWVEPHSSGLSARRLWIGFGLPSGGEIQIDEGAATAISEAGKSLLPVGVRSVEGDFPEGTAVRVKAGERLVGKGLTRMSSSQIEDAVGEHTSVAGGVVIHRDDLVVLS